MGKPNFIGIPASLNLAQPQFHDLEYSSLIGYPASDNRADAWVMGGCLCGKATCQRWVQSHGPTAPLITQCPFTQVTCQGGYAYECICHYIGGE